MNHSEPILPGIAGSLISAGSSLVFLGVGLLESHPIVSDVAVVLSLCAAAFSICASAVTIYKNLRSK
jgi:hypothetical protein